SYINRRSTICKALNELNNYPSNSKCPSINKVAKSFGIPEAILRHAIKNGNSPNRSGPPTILTEHEEN
ncbi:13536_t:CDS:1, partial [Cetraspora pellucida]